MAITPTHNSISIPAEVTTWNAPGDHEAVLTFEQARSRGVLLNDTLLEVYRTSRNTNPWAGKGFLQTVQGWKVVSPGMVVVEGPEGTFDALSPSELVSKFTEI
jgi:hypothetical protein